MTTMFTDGFGNTTTGTDTFVLFLYAGLLCSVKFFLLFGVIFVKQFRCVSYANVQISPVFTSSLKDLTGDFLYFSSRQQISCLEKNQQWTDLLTSIVCVSKAWYILFLCAVDLRCCPKTIKNTSISHTAALGDMFLHHEEFGHVSLFRNGSTLYWRLKNV